MKKVLSLYLQWDLSSLDGCICVSVPTPPSQTGSGEGGVHQLRGALLCSSDVASN